VCGALGRRGEAGVGRGARGPARERRRGGPSGWGEGEGEGRLARWAGWAREGGWAEIHFSFSFLFLSLFYLFQFDIMRKQMIR
jgi:hypothetical protein